jgi:septal ring factor EnvC (AmiA/AmiB activator)
VPEVVSFEDNGIDARGVDYGRLVAVLIEAMKEQQKDISAMQAENTTLLNEHKKVEELETKLAQQQKDFRSTAAQQQKEIQTLAASLKEQASQIQKVSAQLEASKPAPQVVNNP